MPNPVVHFEIRGRDPARLHTFYHEVFGWEVADPFPNGYALVETEPHTHDEHGATTYTGAAEFMNEGVVLEEDEAGTPVWRYRAESRRRYFAPGIAGGIGANGPGVSVSIEVPDLDAALARIEAAGGRTVTPPFEAAPGVWLAGFADPEGNDITLVRAPQ